MPILLLFFLFSVTMASPPFFWIQNPDEQLARQSVDKLNTLLRNLDELELRANIAPSMIFHHCGKDYYRDEFIYKLLNTPANKLKITYNSYYIMPTNTQRWVIVEATVTGHGFNHQIRYNWDTTGLFYGGNRKNCPFVG